MRIFLQLSALGLAASFGVPAAAQNTAGAQKACDGSEPEYTLAAQLDGCNTVISAGSTGSTQLAEDFNNRGVVYEGLKQSDRAAADYSAAIRLKPDYASAFYNRGTLYLGRNDHDRAIADFNEAIRLNPDYAAAFGNRGNAYRYRKEYDHAIADYNEAIRLKPDHFLAFDNRGIAYFLKGDYSRAISDYSEALRLNERSDFYYDRGVAELRLGRTAEGQADISRAIKENPDIAAAEAAYGVRP